MDCGSSSSLSLIYDLFVGGYTVFIVDTFIYINILLLIRNVDVKRLCLYLPHGHTQSLLRQDQPKITRECA